MRTLTRLLATAAAVAAAASIAAPAQPAHARAIYQPAAVFFVPHQDDETLSMGAAIAAHVAAGRDVRVVLLGDGTESGVRPALCTQQSICLTEAAFGAARDREFLRATTALGVPESHIYFEHAKEGQLRYVVGPIIDKYIARFGPRATYSTMSWLDAHPDHYALGYTLNNRAVRGIIATARFYHFQRYWAFVPTPRSGFYAGAPAVETAAAAYSVWAPESGWYAIGSQSVPRDFARLHSDERSKWHLPSNAFASTADAIAAAAWARRCHVSPIPSTCLAH